METPYHVPLPVRRALLQLQASVPPAKLSRTLRTLLLEYLALQPEPGPPELDDVAEELIGVFRLLDAMERKEDNP